MPGFHFSPRPNRASEINWREWDDSAFTLAQTQDKPILLGISAVWCHWCHVMDETTYSDPDIIQFVNAGFVPIRVDNDQRPDVNRRYNLGGWPTTAFLTPTGELLSGGTYIPPEQMRSYLEQISRVYRDSKAEIVQKIAEVERGSAPAPHGTANAKLSAQIVDEVVRAVLDNFDSVYGGFGEEQKFPHTDAIQLALERYVATHDERLLPVVTLTLTKMATGGTYDKVAGGFFRYSTERDWSVPHFEKMLEDNARLLTALTYAYQVTQRDVFLETMRTLAGYVARTLGDDTRGGFYGSQDADEEYYALSLAERAKLSAPFVDRTFYTDWNAMMLAALYDAAIVLRDDRVQALAAKTLERIWNEMYRADVGLFHFCRENDSPKLPNQLSDLGHTMRALLTAYQTTGERVHLQRAQTLADLALTQLFDAEQGAFWSEPRGHKALGLLRVPDKPLNENAVMADALVWLWRLTGEEKYRAAAERTLAFFVGLYPRYGFMAGEYALAVDHLLNEPVTVHIIGATGDVRTRELHLAASGEYAPAKIVQLLDPVRDAARIAQLGYYPSSDAPLAYVCVGKKCLAPVGQAAQLVEAMRQAAK